MAVGNKYRETLSDGDVCYKEAKVRSVYGRLSVWMCVWPAMSPTPIRESLTSKGTFEVRLK